jgi:hypothetical protein
MDLGTFLQLAASAVGITANWRLAYRDTTALYWALASNAVSTLVIIQARQWGLLPVNLMTYAMQLRALRAWRQASAPSALR